MKVALIEDCPLLRRLMVARLESETSIRVVAQASSENAGMSSISLSAPDVVLVDLRIDGGSGKSSDFERLVTDLCKDSHDAWMAH